jgi:hypothetical protein
MTIRNVFDFSEGDKVSTDLEVARDPWGQT